MRQFFGVERGLDIYEENGPLRVRILTGTATPDGVSGGQDTAPIGSLYIRSGAGEIYQKVANAGNANDYLLNGATSIQLRFRPEFIRAVTNENITPGVRDLTVTPFTDDQGTTLTAADFAVNEYIIDNAGAAPSLLQVTAIAGDDVTFSNPVAIPPSLSPAPALAEGDTFLTPNYLPDSGDAQEKQALLQYNGSVMIKVGDVNWNFADGIGLNGYVESQGPILGTDTVQVAIEKTGGDVTDMVTLSGVARGALNLGSWTAPVDLLFSATGTIKSIFQRIGDLLMQLRGVQVTGITAAATVDQVPVASVKCVKWLVEVFEEATPANRKAFEVLALNDGTLVDDSQSAILRLGANFNLTITVDINAGNMRLRAASTTAGVTATARRIEVVKSVL